MPTILRVGGFTFTVMNLTNRRMSILIRAMQPLKYGYMMSVLRVVWDLHHMNCVYCSVW